MIDNEKKITTVALERIKNKTVTNFLKTRNILFSNQFDTIISNPPQKNEIPIFRKHSKSFYLDIGVDAAWEYYKTVNLKHLWSGGILRYGFAYLKQHNKFYYKDSADYNRIQPGMIVFTEVSLLLGLKRILVTHEIVKADDNTKTIESAYAEYTRSRGIQIINLSPVGSGTTQITHTTYYKSPSAFVDKYIYPFFHGMAVTTVHNNIKRLIKKQAAN